MTKHFTNVSILCIIALACSTTAPRIVAAEDGIGSPSDPRLRNRLTTETLVGGPKYLGHLRGCCGNHRVYSPKSRTALYSRRLINADLILAPTVTTSVDPSTVNIQGTGSNEVFTVDLKITGPSIDVVFAIDSSGSMVSNDPNNFRRDASIDFVNMLNSKRDQAAVVSWDDTIDFTYPDQNTDPGLTNNFSQLKIEIAEIDSSGGTNLDVGLGKAVSILDGASNRNQTTKAIVFLTDGAGTYTYSQYKGPTREAADKGYKIYAIGLGSGTAFDPLQDMAESTGGKVFDSPAAENLDGIFTIVYEEVLTSNCAHDVGVVEVVKSYISIDTSSISPPPESVQYNSDKTTTIRWKDVDNSNGFCSSTAPVDLSFSATSILAGNNLEVNDANAKVLYKDGTNTRSTDIPQAFINVNPDVSILDVADDVACAELGTKITYTVSFSNTENPVTVIDYLPRQVELVSAGSGIYDSGKHTVTWNDLTLAGKASDSRKIEVKVTESYSSFIINRATMEIAGTPSLVTAEKHTDSCFPSTKLDLIMNDGVQDDACTRHSVLKYFLLYSTFLSQSNVMLIDVLPKEVELVRASNQGTFDKDSNTVKWHIDTLRAKASGWEMLEVKVKKTTAASKSVTIINYASINSAEMPAPAIAKRNTVICDGGGPVPPKDDAPVALCKNTKVTADEYCTGRVSTHDVDGGCFHPNGDPITSSLSTTHCPLGDTKVTLSVSDGELGDSCQATVSVKDLTPPSTPNTTDYYLWPPDGEFYAFEKVTGNKLFIGDSVDNCSPVHVRFIDCKWPGQKEQDSADCFYDSESDTLYVRDMNFVSPSRKLRGGSKRTLQQDPPPVRTYQVALALGDDDDNETPYDVKISAPCNSEERDEVGNGINKVARLETHVPATAGTDKARRRRHHKQGLLP